MKRIHIYLILLITVSSLIVPCFCLDTKVLPGNMVDCINNTEFSDTSYLEGLSNSNYYIFIKNNYANNSYTLFYSSSPIVFYKTYNMYNRYMAYFKVENSEDVLYSLSFVSSDGLNFDRINNIQKFENASTFSSNTDISFTQCNYDIFDYKTGDIYYTVPSPITILQSSTKGIAWNGVMREVINILPIVLVVVVGLIGIRKGIKFIKSNLIKL